jgi:muramoyltetrapeptide carboxypeptidase
MITPLSLQTGDKIGIVAPARKITEMEISSAISKLEEWGLEVILAGHLFGSYNQYSGSDNERCADLQKMLDDHSIKAVISARGGYGTVRIINKLNFEKFLKHPKWIIGYSDATVLHNHITQNLQIETIHGIMPFKFPGDGADNESTLSLKTALFEGKTGYISAGHEFNKPGIASGELTGGNLSILYGLRGTDYDIYTEGKILFLEDLDEYLYHIDRMMMNLKLGGKLEGIKGLLVGGMTEMRDNTVSFGKTAYEIIEEAVREYDFPVAYGFPAGHTEPNKALILGRKTEMVVHKDKIIFVQNKR